jgi:hypothetical protein
LRTRRGPCKGSNCINRVSISFSYSFLAACSISTLTRRRGLTARLGGMAPRAARSHQHSRSPPPISPPSQTDPNTSSSTAQTLPKCVPNESSNVPSITSQTRLKRVPNASQTRPQHVLKRTPNAPSNTPSSTPQMHPKRIPNTSSNTPSSTPQTRPKCVPNASSNALPMHPHKIQDNLNKFSFFSVSFVSKLNCLGPSPRRLGT